MSAPNVIMKARPIFLAGACVASMLAGPSFAQESAAPAPRAPAAEPPGPPDIVVRGRRLGDLRFEVERAEEAVFARFNEINSTDDFDIHCRYEKVEHLRRRFCMSESWREQSAKMAGALVLAMRGRGDGSAAYLFRREQLRMQRLLAEEMQKLIAEDDRLREAVADLNDAQLALTARLGKATMWRQVTAASGNLPYGAELMFEIVMGKDPWRHRLTRSTFTIANVFGDIRRLEIECAEGRKQIDYTIGVDWTVPDTWSACSLQVDARRGTTFRLYEF